MIGSKVLCHVLIVAFMIPLLVEAACPNKCSGHGTCGANDVCNCQQNWLFGDCSGRQCPFTRAWVDTAAYANDAHYYAECGNHGTCDRETGMCQCDPGYTGSGCRRMDCPNQCSGHGTCEFIEEWAKDVNDKRIGGTGVTYADWDQEKIMGCKCDPWYEGHDCSQKVCPKGDDPLTTTGYEMQQMIVLNEASINFFLTYYDPYGNTYSTGQITGDALTADSNVCANIQTALRALPNHALDGVTVAYSSTIHVFTRTAGVSPYTDGTGVTTADPAADATQIQCIVTFPSNPGNTGLQHLLACDISVHNTAGMQPISSGTATSGTTCTVAEHVPTAGLTSRVLTELAECSNRGLCDGSTGKCECFSGHRGLACESQEALV